MSEGKHGHFQIPQDDWGCGTISPFCLTCSQESRSESITDWFLVIGASGGSGAGRMSSRTRGGSEQHINDSASVPARTQLQVEGEMSFMHRVELQTAGR